MSDEPQDACDDGEDDEQVLSELTIDQLLDIHAKILAEIHTRFGYRENWRAFVIDDRRGRWWKLAGDRVLYQCHEDQPYSADVIENGAHAEDEIYTYRHLKKHVFRTETHTMALVDTHTDGNIFLAIFDNAREVLDG